MNDFIKTVLIFLLVPFVSNAQVQFQRISSSTITNLLPFYSQSLLNGAQVVNLPFTRPTISQGGVPTNLNIDSTYDNLDDTTFETKPIFDFYFRGWYLIEKVCSPRSVSSPTCSKMIELTNKIKRVFV